MKELSIEEKARRFDEALRIARDYHKRLLDEDNPEWASEIEELFPGLKESEDEKIRREIIDILRNAYWTSNRDRFNKLVAWLEKQGNEIANIDIESMVSSYKQRLVNQGNGGIKNSPLVDMCLTAFRRGIENALDELNVRYFVNKNEQKPAWSEEDEVKMNRIVACLETLNVADYDILLKDVDWLKSLKDRYTWKPSEEQIKALDTAIRCGNQLGTLGTWEEESLEKLYGQLKKIRKE